MRRKEILVAGVVGAVFGYLLRAGMANPSRVDAIQRVALDAVIAEGLSPRHVDAVTFVESLPEGDHGRTGEPAWLVGIDAIRHETREVFRVVVVVLRDGTTHVIEPVLVRAVPAVGMEQRLCGMGTDESDAGLWTLV